MNYIDTHELVRQAVNKMYDSEYNSYAQAAGVLQTLLAMVLDGSISKERCIQSLEEIIEK